MDICSIFLRNFCVSFGSSISFIGALMCYDTVVHSKAIIAFNNDLIRRHL